MPIRTSLNVSLTPELEQFVQSRVDSGRYQTASEVVREGLRLLEQREQENQARLEWLRAAAQEGFDAADRDDYVELESEQEIDGVIDEIRREATERLAAEDARG